MIDIQNRGRGVVLWGAVFLLLLLALPYSEAASCSSSEKKALEEEYDDLVADFDDLLEEKEIYKDLRGIEAEVERSDRIRESAVRLALRSVKRDLRGIEDDADEWYLGFLDLVKKSRYEDCEAEVKKFAEEFLDYAEEEIATLQEKLKEVEEAMRGVNFSSTSFNRIQAPVWGEEEEPVVVEENKPAPPATDTSTLSSQEILKKIRAVMKELTALFAQYVAAKQREQ